MIRYRPLLTAATTALTAALLAHCGSFELPNDNVFRIGAQADAVVLGYPPGVRRVNSSRLLNTCLETLIRFDPAGNPTPWLATEWSVDVDTPAIFLTLRRGVSFHDGTRFDAAAVKWNLDQYRASGRTELSKVTEVERLDDYRLKLTLSELDNTILGNLAGAPGTIISPSAFEKHGRRWSERNPIGTGPFRFVSWDRDVRQVYERFDDYWQEGKPYVDGVEWVIIAHPMTLIAAFKNGDVDAVVELAPKDAFEMMSDERFEISRATVGVGGFGLAFDSANPESPFADVRVRRAVIHSVDTNAIIEELTYGMFEPTNQIVSPSHWAYNPGVRGYPYDPDRARELLAEAGYPNGFRTRLTTWNQPALTVDAFTAVQGYLARVGIDAEMALVDTGRLNKIVIGGGWDGLMWCAPGAPNPDATRALSTDLSERSPLWTSVDHPPEYEATLDEARRVPDLEDKQRLTQEVSRIAVDHHAMILYLWSRVDMAARHRNVHDDGLYRLNRTQWTPADVRIVRD